LLPLRRGQAKRTQRRFNFKIRPRTEARPVDEKARTH
jgi:hypothetical protein